MNPVVFIPGINRTEVLKTDENGNFVKKVWPLAVDFSSFDKKFKFSGAKMLLTGRDSGFSDELKVFVEEYTKDFSYDHNGTTSATLALRRFDEEYFSLSNEDRSFVRKAVPLISSDIENLNTKFYFFNYNPFGNALETARALKSFVENIKRETGEQRIDIVSYSIGGVILRAYLDSVSDGSEIDKLVFVGSSLDGCYPVSCAFMDNISLGSVPLTEFASFVDVDISRYAFLLKSIKLNATDKAVVTAVDTVRKNMMIGSTMMWGLVPSDEFREVFNRYKNDIPVPLVDEILSFHNFTSDFCDNLNILKSHGVNIYTIAGYGRDINPIFKTQSRSSDTLLDVTSTCPGAKFSLDSDKPLEKTPYTSPDLTVDLSQCPLRDTTWLFKGQSHHAIRSNDIISLLVCKILSGEVTDIYSDAALPQFNVSRNVRKIHSSLHRAQELLNTDLSTEAREEIEAAVKRVRDALSDTVATTEKNEALYALNAELNNILEKNSKGKN